MRAGRVLDVRLQVQDLEQPPARRGGARQRAHHHAELPDGHLQDQHEDQELGDVADSDVPGQHAVAADPEHQRHRAVVGQGHQAYVAYADVDGAVGVAFGLLGDGVELAHLMLASGERAHDADAAQVLLHHVGQPRQALLQPQPRHAQPHARHGGAPRDHRREAQRRQREHRVGARQQIGAPADQHQQPDRLDHPSVEGVGHRLDVEHAAGDQLAGVHAVVKPVAEPLHLVVVVHSQPVADALADDLRLLGVHHHHQPAHHAGDEDQPGELQQLPLGGARVGSARKDHVHRVHHVTDVLRQQQLEHGRGDRGDHGDGQPHRIGQRHAEHAQHRADAGPGRGGIRGSDHRSGATHKIPGCSRHAAPAS